MVSIFTTMKQFISSNGWMTVCCVSVAIVSPMLLLFSPVLLFFSPVLLFIWPLILFVVWSLLILIGIILVVVIVSKICKYVSNNFFFYSVQVYSSNPSGIQFVGDIKKSVGELECRYIFNIRESVYDIKSDEPLLVLCMHASRLVTDAKHAIKGIHDLKSTVLLILHHKEEHALPNQPSSRILVDSEFDNLKGIYDIACLTGKGVYSCDMNTKTISNILEFIPLDIMFSLKKGISKLMQRIQLISNLFHIKT